MFDIMAQEQQFQNQQELMDQQMRNQALLNKQGQKLGMQTWKATSYPAQVQMMQEAGLNPALMYGGSGGSGGTTSTPSGGGATGGQAMKRQSMDLGTILQAGELKSRIELNNANANQANANAGLSGENAQLTNVNKQLAEQRLILEKGTTPQAIQQAHINTEKMRNTLLSDIAKGKVDTQSADAQISKAGYDSTLSMLQGWKVNKEIELSDAQIRRLANQTEIEWENARSNSRNATTNEKNAITNEGNLTVNQRNSNTNFRNALSLEKDTETKFRESIHRTLMEDAKFRNLTQEQQWQKVKDIVGMYTGIPQPSTTTTNTTTYDRKGNYSGETSTKTTRN